MAIFQMLVQCPSNDKKSKGTTWIELDKGKDNFNKVVKVGRPIRVIHPSGSFKVIRNADNLPEGEPVSNRA